MTTYYITLCVKPRNVTFVVACADHQTRVQDNYFHPLPHHRSAYAKSLHFMTDYMATLSVRQWPSMM
uniref:Uncharacterized protein n=1 Tax=Arundo donax TaxID=35708 RepID=A0A0A9ADA8_ARUDO